MLVKVLIIGAGGAAFVWWQFRDLARARQQTAKELSAKEQTAATDGSASPDTDRVTAGPGSGP